MLHALTDRDIVKVATTAKKEEKCMVGCDTGTVNVGEYSRILLLLFSDNKYRVQDFTVGV
jgi:hypothetical protein